MRICTEVPSGRLMRPISHIWKNGTPYRGDWRVDGVIGAAHVSSVGDKFQPRQFVAGIAAESRTGKKAPYLR